MEQSKTNNGIKFVWLLVFFFLVKSLVLSFWITPLWDVYDETGHFAYIQDIADGKGIPVLGESVISKDIVDVWIFEPEPPPYVTNWIAQHPPGYYLVGALFLKAAGLLTDDPYWLYKAPRVLSGLSAAFALFVFFLIFRLVTNDYKFSLVATACISFIPMYSHMSSGTNHDTFLTLLVAVAVFYWCRYLLYSNYQDALLMGLFLSFAGFAKITALAVALPMLVISFIHIKGSLLRKAGRACLLILVSGAFPGAWMYRNLKLFGNPMPDVLSLDKIVGISHFDKLSSKLSIGIVEFLQSQPVFEGTLISFFGELGWTGSGGGNQLSFGIGWPFINMYVAVALIGLLYSYVWLLKKAHDRKQYFHIYVSIIVIVLYSFIVMSGLDNGIKVFSTIFVGMLPFPFLLFNTKVLSNEKIIYCSIAVVAVFGGAYIFKLREGFEFFGVTRAVSGRYWFPLIPFMVMSFIYPAYLLLQTQTYKFLRLYDWVLFAIVMIFAASELLFYTNKAIPLFQGAF